MASINYFTNDNDWGFYVDMDDIPASIYIISNPLSKKYKPIVRPPSFTLLEEEEEIIIPRKLTTSFSRSFLQQISTINITHNPITKIATILSILLTSISSLLFNIEIVSSDENFNNNK